MAILFVAAYEVYKDDQKEVPWEEVTSTNDYTSFEISISSISKRGYSFFKYSKSI